MPRRREVPKREILPDPVYNSQLVTKFINSLMSQGRKSVAERVFYSALKKVEDRSKDDPIKLFKKAVDNVKPALEVKSRRVGGSNYQVPIEVRPSRRTALAIRWLISYANSRGEKTMMDKLAGEIMDAANNRGNDAPHGFDETTTIPNEPAQAAGLSASGELVLICLIIFGQFFPNFLAKAK